MQHYLSFRISHQWYGINVDNVVEVLHFMAFTELPAASPDILGLMTVRNVVITVIDLRRRFGVRNPTYKLTTPIITAQVGQSILGLAVDDIDNVETVEDDQVVPYEDAESTYIMGVVKLPGKLLLLLNPNSISNISRSPAVSV